VSLQQAADEQSVPGGLDGLNGWSAAWTCASPRLIASTARSVPTQILADAFGEQGIVTAFARAV
jgi:hypothetical protein